MKSPYKFMKAILLILCVFIANIFAQNVMITKNSQLENIDGQKIEYEKFMEMMETGKYQPKAIKDKEGKTLGYRLFVKKESSKKVETNVLSEIPIGKTVSLEIVYHKHILLPVKFNTPNGTEEAWLIFDTGTFLPIFVTPAFQKKISLSKSLNIGDIVVEDPAFGSYQFPEVIDNYNLRYTKEAAKQLRGKPIVGVIGFPMFSDYLISIDVKNQKLHFRNQKSANKMLANTEPFAEVKYRSDLNNIWFPVKINNQRGYAHLDTGYPQTWVEKTQVSGKIKTFSVNEIEFIKKIKQVTFDLLEQKENYSSLKFSLVSNVGNDFLESFILTIDSKEKTLYFELNK